jgi:hypothetical protein
MTLYKHLQGSPRGKGQPCIDCNTESTPILIAKGLFFRYYSHLVAGDNLTP